MKAQKMSDKDDKELLDIMIETTEEFLYELDKVIELYKDQFGNISGARKVRVSSHDGR